MRVRSEVLDRRYQFEYDIGLWTFGTCQVLRDRQTGELFTCKTVPKALVKGRTDTMARLHEVRDLKHPHLCPISDVLQDQQHFFIIYQRCSGGDIGDWMDRLEENEWLQEHTIAAYMGQVLAALTYCHSQRIYHRDLRPCNVMLSSKLPDANILVCDVGLASIFDPDHKTQQSNPSLFTAPELRSASGRVSGGAPDVWSVGAIIHALLIGHPPEEQGFEPLNPSWLFRGAPDREAWSARTPASRDLVRRLLQTAGDRPTTARVLQHPWLRSVVLPKPARGPETGTEVRHRTLCYMLAVLLIPAEVQQREVLGLRQALAQADVDYDGLVPLDVAQEVLMVRLGMRDQNLASPSDVAKVLEIIDVRNTGVCDLCGLTSALAVIMYQPRGQDGSLDFAMGTVGGRRRRCPGAAELSELLLTRFFAVYGCLPGPAVHVLDLTERLCTATGYEMQAHAGVNYEEVIGSLSQDVDLDRETLASELLSSTGRGTPLSWGCDSLAGYEFEQDMCWQPPLSLDFMDSFLMKALLSCGVSNDVDGFGASGKKPARKYQDCTPNNHCFISANI
mmetsp:Transcript_50527/g.97656  ORF Transcript_50527/g.97656 Transcript_50527/m.97656 type:complete len:562 (+) Transcript_50527:52-1737(+)